MCFLQINVLLATSRGVGLEPIFSHAFVQRGGKIRQMVKKFQPHIKGIVSSTSEPVMVYLMAGINDLTTRKQNRCMNYSETVFEWSRHEGAEHLKSLYDWATAKLQETGATVIVCQLAPMNVALWNGHVLNRGHTLYLQCQDDYPAMQQALMQCVADVNAYLVQCYKHTPYYSPPLQRVVTPGKGKKKIQFKWNVFKDGLHMRKEMQPAVIKILKSAIKLNENATV